MARRTRASADRSVGTRAGSPTSPPSSRGHHKSRAKAQAVSASPVRSSGRELRRTPLSISNPSSSFIHPPIRSPSASTSEEVEVSKVRVTPTTDESRSPSTTACSTPPNSDRPDIVLSKAPAETIEHASGAPDVPSHFSQYVTSTGNKSTIPAHISPKRTRQLRSALNIRPKSKQPSRIPSVLDARVSKSVRFAQNPTAEYPPPREFEDTSVDTFLSSKPDGHSYKYHEYATGYQKDGTRRVVFNYQAEVIGAQGALHHQALFKVGLGGGRVKPGKGTLAKRTQVVLYMKEDLKLDYIPVSLGMVFHKIKADNFMPVITVKDNPSATTAALPSIVNRIDPEDPDA